MKLTIVPCDIMQVAFSERFTCTHTSKECGSSCQVTSTFLVSEHPSHCGVILYVCIDSLTRRQGRVPQDELTCKATNQRKTVLQHLGDPQEGLNSVLEQRLRLMVHCATSQMWKCNATSKLVLPNVVI